MAHGRGHNDSPSDGAAGSRTDAGGDLVGELTDRLASLRAEIQRMEQLASDGDSVAAAATGRLDALRKEAGWLEAAVDRSESGEPVKPSAGHRQPPLSDRAGRLHARRRRGVRHVVHLDIWDHDLEALIAAGELAPTDAADPAKVADAVEDAFDRWLHGRGAGEGAVQETAQAPGTGHVHADAPDADAPPAGPRPAAADPPSEDERRETRSRRSGADRRRGRGEISNILGMIEGSPLDRRKSPDRRLAIDRRLTER